MTRVILQPASLSIARKNYENTVEKSVSIERIAKFLTPGQKNKLKENYPDGKFKVWGALPGKGREKYWNEISRGDVILFARDNAIFSSGIVTVKFRNADVAREIWPVNKKTEATWEYLYFIAELTSRSIPYSRFNQLLGYGDGTIIRSFRILNEDQSILVLDDFTDLESETYFDDSTSDDRKASEDKLKAMDHTDKSQSIKARLEQPVFRGWLFKRKKYAICGICHTNYPVAFLHAAHIKKRSKCTHEERTDLDIVMSMCRMGCDDLYERGYISVKDGKVIGLKQKYITPAIEKAKDAVIGNDCTHYNDQTMKYFEWHFDFHGGNKP
ncbi:hypothetical protein [Pedobacter sp.]|jgi:hypothetical protein|uniref:hypothetical protein n=1 Tax=Pedobacter sp. TaxID=1411316 RepID=UPI002C772399|nr:hypothetical protein [Pedobacter sp.]HWW40118.1 hypothetical protein [Pedobacter sp.]